MTTRLLLAEHREYARDYGHGPRDGKQAKIISDKQVRAILAELDIRPYPCRDREPLSLRKSDRVLFQEADSIIS